MMAKRSDQIISDNYLILIEIHLYPNINVIEITALVSLMPLTSPLSDIPIYKVPP